MNIRLLYLYLFAFIGLLITVIGAVQLVDLGLTVLVFPESDLYEYYPARLEEPGAELSAEEQTAYEAEMQEFNAISQIRQRQRQLITALSMIVVGTPLYLYHWGIIKRDGESKRQ